MQQNASVITGASGMAKSEEIKIKFISPECKTHAHYSCPVMRLSIKCECLCHKLIGEWRYIFMPIIKQP